MTTTNVPLPTFTDAGLSVPTEPDILAGVFADWVAAFSLSGKTLNTELTTPQGQIAQSQAYMLSQLYAAFLQVVNGVDPATSSGAFQDALGRIYFITRQAATYATVDAVVSGVVGATLPLGSLAKSSADGSLWATTSAVTFNTGGTAAVTLQAQAAGSGPVVGVNGLSIYQQSNGWEGITNSASVPGTDVESRQSFEERRSASVNIGGVGTAASVRAAIANISGVTDAYVYNNGGDVAITYGATDYPIPAHSMAVIVAGGDDTEIATAINAKLSAGCGLSDDAGEGTLVEVTIQDSTNYVEPYPEYDIRFVRPAAVTIYFRVEVADLSSLPANYVTLVQQAVASAVADGFTTQDGTISAARARIGGQVVAAEYLAPIQAIGSITPLAIYVGTTADPTSGSSITMGIDQQPVTTTLAINVVAVSI